MKSASRYEELKISQRELCACIKTRDIERYKRFIDYNNLPMWEQDHTAVEFESMCRSYYKEWGSPSELLKYRLDGLLHLAVKYKAVPPPSSEVLAEITGPIITSAPDLPNAKLKRRRKIKAAANHCKKPSEGRTTKAHRGDKPAGVTPYGYRYSDDKKSITVADGEAATVKKIFSLSQTGKTIQQIVDVLNGEGIVTRQGKAWTKATVHGMLRNTFYTGVLMHQQTAIHGNHEAIISKVQFGKVQKQLERRHK